MRNLYNLLFYIALPFLLCRLLWKSRHQPAYRQRLYERLGFFTPPNGAEKIWIHAVSVGEVVTTVPLVKRLRQEYPDIHIIMTTMTPTGAERAKELFDNDITHLYVPYDIPFVIKRFLDHITPKAVIIMETEIWPNMLQICKQRHIPVLLANGRLSAKSAASYGRFANFFRQVIQDFALIAAQNQADAERFIALGADPKKVVVTGSIKFDQNIPASSHEKAALFKSLWGQNRCIWVAASTHEGEEEIILNNFKSIKQAVPNLLLILTPRHPERFTKVTQLANKMGYQTILRSQNQPATPQTDIVIGDSMGELCAYYAAGDIAFVGGSLVPIGGHNLLEPAALGIATITGPYDFNFSQITTMLLEAGAISQIKNGEELAQTLISWMGDNEKRLHAGEQGKQVVEKNRGAVDSHMKILGNLLNQQGQEA